MDWKEISASVVKFAPMAGAIIGGVPGAAVSAAGSLIASALGVEPTPEAVDAAIKSDPEAAAKIRQMELDHIVQMRTLVLNAGIASQASDLESRKVDASDRADARARDAKLQASVGGNGRANLMVAMDVLGLLAGLAGMVALGLLKAQHPDAMSEGVFGALLAQLSTITSYFGLCLRDAHQFEFGSSRGSRDKDHLKALGAREQSSDGARQ